MINLVIWSFTLALLPLTAGIVFDVSAHLVRSSLIPIEVEPTTSR